MSLAFILCCAESSSCHTMIPSTVYSFLTLWDWMRASVFATLNISLSMWKEWHLFVQNDWIMLAYKTNSVFFSMVFCCVLQISSLGGEYLFTLDTIGKCSSIPMRGICVVFQRRWICVGLGTFLALESSLLEMKSSYMSLHFSLETETFTTERARFIFNIVAEMR